MTEKKNPVGSPSTYTKEIGEEICLKISTSDYGLKRLCLENPHWPCRQTILEWRIKIKDFGDMYAKAKQDQVETLVDDCLDIADDTSRDTLIRTNKDGEEYEVCNTEWINRSRLRIDTRKFMAQKLAPKIYGDQKEEKPETNIADALIAMKELAEKCLQTKT
jgi:hypothetical protein